MIELSELIGQLRAELATAMAEGQDQELRFALGPVELELTLAVERDAAASGKVRFWVTELSAEAKLASSTTQTVRLTLEPRMVENGTPATALISGYGVPRER